MPHACDLRPARCGECAANGCPYGEEPGLRGAADRPLRLGGNEDLVGETAAEEGDVVAWPPFGRDVFRDYAELWEDMVRSGTPIPCARAECPLGCGWAVEAPDTQSAAVALGRHVRDNHGGAA